MLVLGTGRGFFEGGVRAQLRDRVFLRPTPTLQLAT